jgi:iron complex outermembrane receptor protein
MLLARRGHVPRAVAVLLAVPAITFAQTGRITGTVSGIMSGVGAAPLVGAQVLLSPLGLSAQSGDGGKFTIQGVPAGKYDLKVHLLGYKSLNVSGVAVGAGGEAKVAFHLERTAVQLTSVVVAASRRVRKITDAPATITALDTSAIENTIGNSYLPALKWASGLEFHQAGVLAVFVNARGFNNSVNSRTAMMEDGRIATLPETGLPAGPSTTISKLDLATVEVVVGPGSALYGPNATNGVILLSTKDPKQYPGWAVELSGGSRNYYGLQGRYAGASGKWGYKIAGEYVAADDWTDVVYYPAVTVGGAPLREQGHDYRTDVIRGSGSIGYYFDDGARLLLTAGLSKRNGFNAANVGRIQLSNFAYRDYQLQYAGPRWFAQAYHTNGNEGTTFLLGPFTQRLVLFPSLSRDSVKSLSAFPADGRLYAAEVQNNFSVGMLGRTGIRAFDDAHVTWGAQFRHDRVSSYRHDLSDRRTGRAIELEEKGAYAQLDAPLGDAWRVVLAGRYDVPGRFATQFSPKAGLLYTPAQDQTLRLTYNKAYSVPSVRQTDYYSPNTLPGRGLFGNLDGFDVKNSAGTIVRVIDPIRPEKNDTWELGYRGALAGRLYVDVAGYRSSFRDFISPSVVIANPTLATAPTTAYNHKTGAKYTDESGSPQIALTNFNLGEATITGVDAGLKYYLADRVVASANLSFVKLDTIKSKPTDPPEATALNSPSSRITAGMDFTDYPARTTSGFSIRYVNAYDFRSGVNYGRVPPFGALDLNATYRPRGSRATVTLQAQNVFVCSGGTSTPPAPGSPTACRRTTPTAGRAGSASRTRRCSTCRSSAR